MFKNSFLAAVQIRCIALWAKSNSSLAIYCVAMMVNILNIATSWQNTLKLEYLFAFFTWMFSQYTAIVNV